MLIELGPLHPDAPGLMCFETIIPDDMKMNPECSCQVRNCPKHGFCVYCKIHHDEQLRAQEYVKGVRGCQRHSEEITYLDNAFSCGGGCEECGQL